MPGKWIVLAEGGGEEWKQGDQCEEAITVAQVRNDVGVDQGDA